MDFVDTTLLKLAAPAERAAVFDQDSLGQIAATAYDVEALAIEGPYQPVFDDLRLGPSVPAVVNADGTWQPQSGAERTDVHLTIAGLAGAAAPRVDAIWRGSIVARAIPLDSVIEDVSVDWPDPGNVDAAIIAADGALPTSPSALETERRQRLIDHIKASMADPEALTDDRFDRLLTALGATTVGELIERVQSTAVGGAVTVTFSAPTLAQPAPRELPVAVALLIRDAGAQLSIATLLAESHALRDRLEPLSLERPADPALRVRARLVVAWALPATVFDDPSWPGATAGMSPAAARDARRATAGEWLADEGIGLVAVA